MNASSDPLNVMVNEVCKTTYDRFSEAVIHQAKIHILDTLGVALAGASSHEVQSVLQSLKLGDDFGGAVIWGHPFTVNPRAASFVNGIAAHALELDDCGGCDHSGAVVVPAVLAILPELIRPVTGKELISSVIMGYEVGRRLLEAAGGYEAHNGLGWHSTGTCGVFGAAAAAGMLLNHDAAQLASALGIACSYAGGTWSFIHDGSQTKKLHPGRAAEGGVISALLAAGSFRGPASVFSSTQWGSFFTTFAHAENDPSKLFSEFGENWRLSRCSIKPYATCRGTHSGIDALESIFLRHPIALEDIASVKAQMSQFQFGMCGGKILHSKAQAQMSLPYALAAKLHFGKVGLSELEPSAWSSPAIQGWLEKINVSVDPSMTDDAEPIISVTTQGKQIYTQQIEFPLGSPSHPLSDQQVIDKFLDLSSGVLPLSTLLNIQAMVLGLETLEDARELPLLLRTQPLSS
jgi:2-methylcitrate dehydratase PrpD